MAESLKKVVSGSGVPKAGEVELRYRTPQTFRFRDDGETPNNPGCAFVRYRTPVVLDPRFDPAAIFEVLFAHHGWKKSWRDGVYDFLHFHTHTHEVLGIARGWARVRFGGRRGRVLVLKAADVVILPAGTGHQRLDAARDLLVVGAYPVDGGKYDEPRPGAVDHAAALRAIAKVSLPAQDPVYGKSGPLRRIWKRGVA